MSGGWQVVSVAAAGFGAGEAIAQTSAAAWATLVVLGIMTLMSALIGVFLRDE